MPGIKFALGENPKQLPRHLRQTPNQPLRYPTTRAGVEFVIRDAFTRAKAYQKAWKDYEKKPRRRRRRCRRAAICSSSRSSRSSKASGWSTRTPTARTRS